ncbi:MAG TPA: RimK family protein [Candidatus Eisenbacteria bacterium]|nr:RimK family protein [Candidatus Eisenbacteria bacterium]
MAVLLVVENPKNWKLHIPGTLVVPAREYVSNPRFAEVRRAKVFNFCRAYSYQSLGYYVSLLAAARGHLPLPSVKTLQDLRHNAILRIVSEDLEEQLQRTFSGLQSDRFELSIYFGRNMAKRYNRIAQAIFNHFPAPFLRAEFVRKDDWELGSLRPIATSEIPESHRPFVIEEAQRYFGRRRERGQARMRYELAILVNPQEIDAPSDGRAIQRFCRAARAEGLAPTLIEKEDFGRLAEFDALFIRETTSVNHHTFRFANGAAAEGLVVIDDPISILRCTNKVYQAELFLRHGIPSPRSMIVHRDNRNHLFDRLGSPCVLKRPDSSFSQGVVMAASQPELEEHLESFLSMSELVVAQEFVPSAFDWRVGVFNRRPLFVCKYFMARGHWQIQESDGAARRYGKVETLPLDEAPGEVLVLATKAAGLIGDGLYGVDLKKVNGRVLVMEVNDNPSIDAGVEDAVLRDDLYRAIMRGFVERLEQRGRAALAGG